MKPPKARPNITREIYRLLSATYGFQGWWPIVTRAGRGGRDAQGYRRSPGKPARETPLERLEIILGAVLTQNTAWENARRALEALRGKGLLEVSTILRVSRDELASAVRSSGYFNQKARKIKAVVGYLEEGGYLAARPGKVPPRDGLLAQWGIGPETADSILLYAYRHPIFVVDAYTERMLLRVGLIETRSYESTQGLFHAELEPDAEVWGEYHALIVRHGKEHCRAHPVCEGCPLLELCAYGRSSAPYGRSGEKRRGNGLSGC